MEPRIVVAAMAPLAATGGIPIPGNVLEPHNKRFLSGVLFPGIGIPPVAASGAMAANTILGSKFQRDLIEELDI